MMKTERKLKLLFAAAMHLDAEERRTCPVETRLPFRCQPRRDHFDLFERGKMNQILNYQRRSHRAMDQLQRLAETRHIKRRAQHRMSRHQPLDCAPQSVFSERYKQ